MSTYHFDKTYEWNYEHGPDFQGEFPQLDDSPNYSLFGIPLNSPVGISAGILLNSKWVETYSKLGFDILTYKTVRSSKRPSYEPPNWVFLEVDAPLEKDYDHPLIAYPEPRRPIEKLTSAVCYGMPSADPAEWREDIAKAKQALKPGQMLIVSVVGTPNENNDQNHLANDYAQCAEWAVDAGADAIEANISCPNVNTAEGEICHSTIATRRILERIRERIPETTPLLTKIGTFEKQPDYENYLAWTAPYIQGVVLVNCLSRRIHTQKGEAVFGSDRERAGVIGWGIYHQCLMQLRMILEARQSTNTNQAIMFVGGLVWPPKATNTLQEGADAILLGGAPVFDPYLAVKIKEHLPERTF